MSQEFTEEQRKGLHAIYHDNFRTPFSEKFEENWEEETYWKAVEVFKVQVKELGVEKPFDFFGRFQLHSYEDIRDKLKAGPPMCTRKNWKSPIMDEKVDVLGLLEKLHHVSGAKYEGKEDIVILDFWATWCGPCIAIAPELSDLSEKHLGRVAVIGINNDASSRTGKDDVEKVQAFLGEHKEKFRYIQYVDNAENLAKTSLHDRSQYIFFPALVLVVNGIIKFVGEKAHLQSHFEEALKTSCPEE